LEKKMKKGIFALAVVLLFSATVMASEASSPADVASAPQGFPVIASFDQTFLDSCDAEIPTNDNQLLGVEFDEVYYWATGGGYQPHGGANWMYKLDRDCNLVDDCEQGTTSSWGIRDLAYDNAGVRLFGSDDYGLWSFPPACPLVKTALTPPTGYAMPCRALAYDPVTDHLWTGNFSNDIVEFDYNTGQVFCRASNSYSVYGAAWDDQCYAEWGASYPMLWIFAQNGTPALTHYLFDPVLCAYEGSSWMGIDPVGSDDMAGGHATDWGFYEAGVGAALDMNQGTPRDIIMAYELCSLTGLSMTCNNLTPIFCRGKNVYFQVSTNNTTGGPLNVTMTFTGYAGYDCQAGNEMVAIPKAKTIPDGSDTKNYFFKVPNAAGPGPYSAKVSFSYGGTTYECCMNFTCIQCQPWRAGDNTEWVWEEVSRPEVVPTTTTLAQNYPNPFNAETSIGYTLADAGNVNLSVYDISGRLVETLVDGYQSAGEHIASWNASGVSSGVYFYKLSTASYSATKMMNLLK
jgi:hypothetical protein